jgi:hypothetical protein
MTAKKEERMEKDYSLILQEISRKLSRPTVEFIYRTAQELQPQAKAILDDAFFSYPAGKGDPADAFLTFVNEVIDTSFAAGIILGATDTTDEMRELIKEWQQGSKGPLEIPGKDPHGGLTGTEILAEVPGSGVLKD